MGDIGGGGGTTAATAYLMAGSDIKLSIWMDIDDHLQMIDQMNLDIFEDTILKIVVVKHKNYILILDKSCNLYLFESEKYYTPN